MQADVVTYTSLLTCFASAAKEGIPGDWVQQSVEVKTPFFFNTHSN